MERTDDLVAIPLIWIPPNVLKLISLEPKENKKNGAREFFTDQLEQEAYFYYIDDMGRLIYKNYSMYVVKDYKLEQKKQSVLLFDIQHQVVLEPELDKVYAVIKDKMCILELSFREGILKQVNSIIE